MALLVEILDAIEMLPWSSQVCEEAHAAAAVMMRFHPDFHEDTLFCRAMLYNTKPLLGRSDTELLVGRLQARAHNFVIARPQARLGRQVYFKKLVTQARKLAEPRALSHADMVDLMKVHFEKFAALPPRVRLHYEIEAEGLQEKRAELKADAQVSLHA